MSTSPFPFPTTEHHEAAPAVPQPEPIPPTEASLDHGVAESFPASDPVSVSVTKLPTPVPPQAADAGADPGDDQAQDATAHADTGQPPSP